MHPLQQDADASELDEAAEVLGVVLLSGDQAPEVLQPGEEPLDLPTPHVASQGSAVLGSPTPTRWLGSDHLDASFLQETLIEVIAVVGLVADQSLGSVFEEAVVERLLDERDFMRRSTRDRHRREEDQRGLQSP